MTYNEKEFEGAFKEYNVEPEIISDGHVTGKRG